ncbi:retrotransposon protein, putative, ty1-copia subclass [Tanacetum coccineum]
MTKRAIRISQSKALTPVADETVPPIRDDRYGEAFPTATSLDAGQDRENIPKTSAMPHESFPRVTSLGGDKDSLKQKLKELMEFCVQEDAPNRGGIDQGEVNVFKGDAEKDSSRSTNKGSESTGDLANVLSSMGAANILASGGLKEVFTTASPQVPPFIFERFNFNTSISEQGGLVDNVLSKPMIKFIKETGCHSVFKVNNTEKSRKPTMYRSQRPRGNQRNWNNQKFQQLGSDFVMIKKAWYVCRSFEHLQYTCKHKRHVKQVKPVWNNSKRVNHHYSTRITHPIPKRNMIPQAILMRSGRKTINAAKPKAVHNAVKASACWVWKPKNRVIDQVPPVSSNVSTAIVTASEKDPTAEVLTTARDTTPYTRRPRASREVVIRSTSPIPISIPSAGKEDKRKGKEIMTEPEKPAKAKVQEQMSLQLARELQEEFVHEDQSIREQIERDAEIVRIHAEEDLRQMINELDRSNVMINKHMAEYEEAENDLTIEEKTELITELINYQKDFARIKKYQAQQQRLASKSERRKFYTSVLRSHAGWKTKDLRGMTFDQLEEKFIPVWESIQDFVPMDSKKESESLKRSGILLEKVKAKRLKTSDVSAQEQQESDNQDEIINLQQWAVLVREETSVNITPSVVKVPICDWKIYKDKLREVYQIFRVGQAPKVYPYFESMLKDFDRDDLVTLWKLVKDRFKTELPKSDLEKCLFWPLKVMFEPVATDLLWQFEAPIKSWKMYKSCKVHCLSMEGMIIYMLDDVEYPFQKTTLKKMLDHKCELGLILYRAPCAIKGVLRKRSKLALPVLQGFREARKLKQRALYLYVGNGVLAQVEAIGSFDLVLPNGLVICLDNCHYAPSITRGVVSVHSLVENGFVQCFMDFRILVSKHNVLYFNAIPSNGIYEIDTHDLVPNVNYIYSVSTKRAKHNLDSTYLWHCRLAHISKKHIENLQQEGLLKSTDDESFDQCVSCLSGKMTRKSHVSRQGASYFITFTDYYSRYGYVYLLKHKHEVFETFKVSKKEVENQLGKTIKALRSDRGGEYISQEFKDYLKACGIVQQLTPPYTPQHNGVSERRNHTLLDMVRSMMNLTTLLLSFWDYAL